MAETALVPAGLAGLDAKTRNKLIKMYERERQRDAILQTFNGLLDRGTGLAKALVADEWGRHIVITGTCLSLSYLLRLQKDEQGEDKNKMAPAAFEMIAGAAFAFQAGKSFWDVLTPW